MNKHNKFFPRLQILPGHFPSDDSSQNGARVQSDAHLQKGSKRENGRIIKTIRNTEALAWSSAAVCFFDLKIKDEICVCPAKAKDSHFNVGPRCARERISAVSCCFAVSKRAEIGATHLNGLPVVCLMEAAGFQHTEGHPSDLLCVSA